MLKAFTLKAVLTTALVKFTEMGTYRVPYNNTVTIQNMTGLSAEGVCNAPYQCTE